jgi:carbohydrate diacid regulator
MHISVKSANQIVKEISNIVKQHVNMMDSKGYIIASTDPSRVGNFHKGAKKIIDDNLNEFYVTPETETYSTRAGINLPITINEKVIGVIGITGEYDKVINYGQIVKKMTEILVRESYFREQERLDKKIESRFLEEWILGQGLEFDQAFKDRGSALKIDITIPRRAMVMRIQGFQQLSITSDGQKLIEKIEKSIRRYILEEPGNVYLRLTTKQICLVTPRSDSEINTLAQKLIKYIKNSFNINIYIGIDNYILGTVDVKKAYLKANKASHACIARNDYIVLYKDINMEIFMAEIPTTIKEEYLYKIFPDCSFEKMRSWIIILEAYFYSEGSISKAAEKLFMHKNTLQYKLIKLKECTGYDVRLPSNSAVFYIAILFFHDVRKNLAFLDN